MASTSAFQAEHTGSIPVTRSMKTDRKTTPSLLTPDQRKFAIDKIIDYFANERDEVIGIIAAGDLLDMFLEIAGANLFNRGIKETKELIKNRHQELDFEIELLLKDS